MTQSDRTSRRAALRLMSGAGLALATGACSREAAEVVADNATVLSQSSYSPTPGVGDRPVTGLSLDNNQLKGVREAGLDRRVSGFVARRWQDHFSSLREGAMLVDTDARALHFWAGDQSIYKIYPTSVPLTEDLTRRGRTTVVQKREGPDWRPTPNMLRRNPELPAYVGPGPQNPLGTHALYLGWRYYRIHGTNDTRKIGRRSSSGCIGLYNEDIAELFSWSRVGMQVLVV